MTEAREAFNEADSYFRISSSRKNHCANFGNEIRFNLLGMAIEKFCMSILHSHCVMPENHSFTDLKEALAGQMDLPEWLGETLVAMDLKMHICSLAEYRRQVPDDDELASYFKVGEYLRAESAGRLKEDPACSPA